MVSFKNLLASLLLDLVGKKCMPKYMLYDHRDNDLQALTNSDILLAYWGLTQVRSWFSQTNPSTTGPFGNTLWSVNWGLTWSSMGMC